MVSFKLKKSETIPLTRALCIQHRDMDASLTERELKVSRTTYLKTKIEEGLFLPVSWAVAEYQGNKVRMNGHHSSTMLAGLPEGGFPDGMQVHIDTYEVSNVDGFAELFRQFDARQSSRSSVDVTGAYVGIYGIDVDPKLAIIAAKGINFYRSHVEGGTFFAGDDVGRIFNNENTHEFTKWYCSLPWKKFKEGKNQGVASAMWGTWRLAPEATKEFWGDVLHDREENEVAHMLDFELQQIQEGAGKYKNGERKKAVKPGFLFGISVKAWNAWRANRVIRILSFDPKKDAPDIAA